MNAVIEYLREFNFVSVTVRLLLAMAAGGLFGSGRSKHFGSAEFPGYMLTGIGAALTVIIAMYEYHMLTGPWAGAAEDLTLMFDSAGTAALAVSGIGFFAACTIIAGSHQPNRGLPVAGGLFLSAIMGIAAGAGFFEGVLIAMVMIIITLEVLEPLEAGFKRKLRSITVIIELNSLDDMDMVKTVLAQRNAALFDMKVERVEKDRDGYPACILAIRLGKEHPSHSGMLSSLAELPCVYSIRELIS